MSSISRREFIQELMGRQFDVAALRADPAFNKIAVPNGDGKIDTPEELDVLFRAIDRVDRDGDPEAISVTTAAGALTQPGMAMETLRRLAGNGPRSPYRDIALGRTFTAELTTPLARGASGPRVVALQYALSRLDLLTTRIDGNFGGDTLNALTRFQSEHGLPVTGALTHETLLAIDAIVSADRRTPAERARDPWTVLNDFSSLRRLPAVTGTPINWNNPTVQAAYRQFVVDYWPVMRDNNLEMDCKTVSLLFVRQFRRMLAEQQGITLGMPKNGTTVLPAATWAVHTPARPGGLFSRIDGPTRPGYDAVRRVQALDPLASVIAGVNLRNEGISADLVSRVAQPLGASIDNGGAADLPEIDVSLLQPGDMMLLNHNKGPANPDRTFDHAVTVVGVDRTATGTTLRLAVGSFDDMKDADSTTPPAGASSINFYMEELVVHINAAGRITGFERPWRTESAGEVAPRYTPQNTLMERNPGGSIFAGRFGS